MDKFSVVLFLGDTPSLELPASTLAIGCSYTKVVNNFKSFAQMFAFSKPCMPLVDPLASFKSPMRVQTPVAPLSQRISDLSRRLQVINAMRQVSTCFKE